MIEVKQGIKNQKIGTVCLVAPHGVDAEKHNVTLSQGAVYDSRRAGQLLAALKAAADQKVSGLPGKAKDDARGGPSYGGLGSGRIAFFLLFFFFRFLESFYGLFAQIFRPPLYQVRVLPRSPARHPAG